VEPNYNRTARVFTLTLEHLGYVMRCFASISDQAADQELEPNWLKQMPSEFCNRYYWYQ